MEKLKAKIRSMISVRGGVFIILSALVLCFYYFHIDGLFTYQTGIQHGQSVLSMENGKVYSEEIKGLKDGIRQIRIQFATYIRENKGTLTVRIREQDHVLKTWTMDTSKLVDNGFQRFETANTVAAADGGKLYLDIVDEYEQGTDNYIAVYICSDSERTIRADRERFDGTTFAAQWTLVNIAQSHRYKALYFSLGVVIALLLAWFTDFGTFDWKRGCIAAIAIMYMMTFVDYDIASQFCTSIALRQWQDSEASVEIGASGTQELELGEVSSGFDKLEFFTDVQPKALFFELIDAESGETVLSQRIRHYSNDTRTSKLGISVEKTGGFAAGHYAVRFVNAGDAPIRIYTTDTGELNAYVSRDTSIAHVIFMLALAILAISGIFIWKVAACKYDTPRMFISMAIPLALIYLVLFVPWSQPDTGSHFLATYRYSNLLLGLDENAGRQEDVDFYQNVWGKNNNPSLISYDGVFRSAHLKCQDASLVEMDREEKMDYYSIVNYLPEVLGLALGRKLGLGIVPCLYLSRAFILAAYLYLCWYSIVRVPMGKAIFALISLLPMSLMMSSAISYDPLVIALSLAFIASVLHLKKDPLPLRGWLEAGLWAFLLGAVKGGGYAAVLLPMLLMLLEKDRKRFLGVACVALAGLFSLALFDKILPSNHLFQLGEAGSGRMSASYAIKNPLTYLNMCLLTYIRYLDTLVINTGGIYLGWLESTLPSLVVMLMYFTGGYIAVRERDALTLERRDHAVMLAVVLIGVIGTPAMLLSWTPIGRRVVEGLQGRYYLPFVPLVMLMFLKRSPAPVEQREGGVKGAWRVFFLLSAVAVYYMLRLYLTRQ